MLQQLDTKPLEPADRAHFSQIAGRFLGRIAGDRDRYPFYNVADFQEKLVSVANQLAITSQSSLLAGLGTADSQWKLVQLAARGSASPAERSFAANAFGHSVKRFGMRLDRSTTSDCYELYNRLGPQDAVAAKTLGYCLDVIEAYAGRLAWPEGL
jgi:hypothetical protein